MTSPDDLSFEHVFEEGQIDTPAYTGLLLHGTGADQHDLLPLGRALTGQHPLLSPLGQVREQDKPRWFRRVQEGVFDEDSIRDQASKLAAFVDEARQAYPDTPDPFVAIGFSNGANIAAALLLLHPHLLQGAVLLRAMVPLIPEELPDLDGLPVHIASGERDPLIDAENARRLAAMLGDAGADVTHVFSEGAHELDRDELVRIRRWLTENEERFRGSRE